MLDGRIELSENGHFIEVSRRLECIEFNAVIKIEDSQTSLGVSNVNLAMH